MDRRTKAKRRSARADEGRSRKKSELEIEVEKRFGVLPNFFCLSPETPEITANLWGFAKFAYLDNPLPSLFKERLFVYLSRFCEVRYCIARHVGFLAGLGRPSGDAQSPVQTVDEIIQMLEQRFPRGDQLLSVLSLRDSLKAPLKGIPSPGSEMENSIFVFAGHVFLQTADVPACLARLEALLGEVQLQYLITLLLFVRSAHYWTKVHPELVLEEDIKRLLQAHEALADCVLRNPEAGVSEVSQKLLDELPSLRNQAAHATNLLAAIVDSSDDAIISKNLDGVITSWNKSAEQLFGYTAQEAIGQPILLIVPADRRDEEKEIIGRIRRGERIEHFETVRVRKDGTTFDISLTVSPVRDSAARVIGASKVAREITERKRAEKALAEQGRLLDLSNDAILVRDANDRVTYWNKSAEELYGYTREEAVRHVTHDLFRTEFPKPLECIREELHRDNRWTGELIHTRKDGTPIIVMSRWTLIRDVAGNPQTVLEANNDMTRQKQVEETLRESEDRLRTLTESLEAQVRLRTRELEQRNAEITQHSEQLRDLSGRLLQIQDEERRHIARELHDSTGQFLALLNMNLSRLQKESTKESSSAKQWIEDCISLSTEVTRELRTVSYLLHPPLLDELGLASALKWLLEGFEQRSHISVTLDISENVGRLPRDLEIVLFRIVQESLTNIHRHSGSKTAGIRLSQSGKSTLLEIQDQGKGISAEKLAKLQSQGSGVGIAGMRERIRPFGGALNVHSNGPGTKISVTVPATIVQQKSTGG